jgi:hypothetical protein
VHTGHTVCHNIMCQNKHFLKNSSSPEPKVVNKSE